MKSSDQGADATDPDGDPADRTNPGVNAAPGAGTDATDPDGDPAGDGPGTRRQSLTRSPAGTSASFTFLDTQSVDLALPLEGGQTDLMLDISASHTFGKENIGPVVARNILKVELHPADTSFE